MRYYYYKFDQMFNEMRYPAGESHVSLKKEGYFNDETIIEKSATCFDDLAVMVTANEIVKHLLDCQPRWFVPYFPFARHDRRIDKFDGLELKLAMEMVADLDITIADPHSDVSGMLHHIPQSETVKCYQDAGAFDTKPLIVIPDTGATKKAESWLASVKNEWKLDDKYFIQASKRRDVQTGKLSGFELFCGYNLGGRPCIIIDDICDGGGTFLGLADLLIERKAGPLTLCVTHGLFTQGVGKLLDKFHSIYTFGDEREPSSSFPASREGVTTIPWRTLYEGATTV